MEKFLTYVAIFAFAIPTIAVVTTVIILIILALILLLAVILSRRTRRKSRRPPSPGGWNQQGEIRSVYPFQPPLPPLPQQSVRWGQDPSTQQSAGWGQDPSTQQSADRGQYPSTPQPVGWGQQTPSTLPPTQGITEGPIIPQRENRKQPESPQNQPTTIPPNPTGNVWPDLTMANTGIAPTQITGAGASTPATPSTPARFILRSEKGNVLQEYPLEKPEISIGRAPNSDILLSQDKLTSRRHATIRYENGSYVLHDEQSANGTFVNGQQLSQSSSRILHDGDHVGIGEHELTFHGYPATPSVEDMPAMSVQLNPVPAEATFRTREDTFYTDKDAYLPEHDDFSTRSVDNSTSDPFAQWIQAVPAPPPESSSTTPPAQPGVQYSPAAPESPEKHGAIPPVPAPSLIASPPVFASMPKSAPPVYSAEQLRFTAFHPKEVIVETWNTLLVYAHIEPVVEAINKDAQRFKAELGAAPRKVSAPATQLLLRETNISIVPECKGVTFNPKRFTFKWLEDWHRASFRFQAKPELAESAGNGRINIFAGPLLVGTLKMALLFEERDTSLPAHSGDIQETANLYKQIFASYSHDDSLIVITCRDVFKTLGYNTLIDIDTLRAGQKFSDALKRMIDAADIFQLFWSERSAKSTYVAEEWQYALGLNRGEGFVRPVYWEVPMAQPPEKLAPLHFAYLPAYTFIRQQSPSR